MAEERESFESQWAPSDVTEEDLKEMVAHGVLPAKEIIGWRPACGEAFPTPDTHEVVVFSHFFYGGFSLPTSRFFRGILEFYGISLHHLNPNSIVHIANFIHACEAFLGIRPHFALFRHIFFLKPQPNKSKPCIVGGAGFQLRGTLSQKYFSMPSKTSNKGWHANWFYVQNPEPALPEYTCLPPAGQASGRPKIRSDAQPNTSKPTNQSDSRKRKLVLSDDEGDDVEKAGSKGVTGKQPRQANPKKKTSSRPIPKIRKSSRKPYDIDPSGKDSEPTGAETSPTTETGPTAKDRLNRKIKSQAQFDVLVNKIKKLEGAGDEVANAATPLIQAMFFNNNGPSSFDAVEIFDKLRAAPDTYFKNIKEAGCMGASLALAMTKSLYPKIDIDAVDDFADGTSEEHALDLINDAQKAADKITADVVERFQDNNLGPTGSGNSDDEKTESDLHCIVLTYDDGGTICTILMNLCCA
uniref:Gypsy-type retrotransposon protein n=1 Tax=Oryza sativa subsp. japonica TaxID=39947 RepID=Q84T43_ORYSJ|nr:putative gypsy-type retrotransposon protein [Oryza sativa Japonica Group]